MSRIPIVRNSDYRLNGPKSYAYALIKYNLTPSQPGKFYRENAHSKLMMKNTDGAHAIVTADDVMNDSFYTCPVQVGTPPQTLDLNLDSGSSDLWFWSTKLDKRVQRAGKANEVAIFDTAKSSTFKPVPSSTWKITYGDGSGASGVVGTDDIQIGDITVKGQAIELATEISSSFQNQTSSGLLGLAWGDLNTVTPTPVKTPVENMIAQGSLPTDAQMWSCYLGSVKDINDPDHGNSWYLFGPYDKSVVEASGQEIAWTLIDNTQGFWMFDSDAATINGQTLELPEGKAMADTGTTLMLCDDKFCQALYDAVDGARFDPQVGGWILPSDNIDKRPELKVKVGADKYITIEKEQLSWAELEDGSGMSFGSIQSNGNAPFAIFGDTFLQCCYAIFDVGNQRFGCVQRPDPTPAGK
ncbi:hypothetical protein LTR64_000412 [Lithohypha guttulata]|uniref:uncharacterized protein n=1 Tax=Lithohypha guttulata TaxID=1690604 RepID=UPI002DE1839F|nr:hypothetical protein LTR51_005822 [Lithohypha guttulata]